MFNSQVLFYRGEFEDFKELLRKEGFGETLTEQFLADGLTFDFDLTQAIWINSNASNSVKIHELLHAVLNICSVVGIDRNDDEVLCYMLEYLYKSI